MMTSSFGRTVCLLLAVVAIGDVALAGSKEKTQVPELVR
jgi:hypothetical protein